MAPPSTDELKAVILDILSSAQDNDQLSQLTVRIVRQKLAIHFDIEEDVLNGGDYKSFIKATVHAAVNNLRAASEVDAESPPVNVPEKKKEKGKTGSVAGRTGARQPRAKAQMHSLDEQPAVHESENDARPPKKASTRSKPSKSSKMSNKPESDVKYKSKAIIESSDDKDVPQSGAQRPVHSPRKEKGSAKSRQKQQQKTKKNVSDVEMDPGPSSSNCKPNLETGSPKDSVSKGKELNGDPMESELSSVIDEPPKKRQKKQEKESTQPESTRRPKDERNRRGKKEALSKDEETTSRLKNIVVACGVRKVWKKEFKGLDKPSQQIKRLHSILGDLGMTPRYSLEKAKVIREQRELAQELKDVQEFDKATKKRGRALHSSSVTVESADRGDSDGDVPTRKKQNARASIMAFLQDQSEEE